VQASSGSRVPWVFVECPVGKGTGGAQPAVSASARFLSADGKTSRTATRARKGFVMAKNIYVGNLVWDATQDDLYNLFQEHGKVTRAQVIMDRETGRSRGFGFVEMENDGEADRAITALNGADFRGRPLTVNEAKPRDDRGGPGGGRGFGGGGGGGRGGPGGGGRGGYGGGTDRGRRY
jgi:RNA recognition motif-containing protein